METTNDYSEVFLDGNFDHLMLDLETMGKRAGCAIVSIGAVEFKIETGEIGRSFYERVDLQSCLDKGMFIEASTLYWWLQQSEKARLELCQQANKIEHVLSNFNSFCGKDKKIWGNGASFDISILEAAYYACKMKEPWLYRNERDVRTLLDLAPNVKNETLFTGVEHNPIDDCIYQIRYCSKIWNLKNGN